MLNQHLQEGYHFDYYIYTLGDYNEFFDLIDYSCVDRKDLIYLI